jgi:hypothetical protein
MEGYLSKTSVEESQEILQRLVRLTDVSDSNVYVDTLVSPSYTAAVSMIVQLPGISGKENNLVLFEFARDDPEGLPAIVENYRMVASSGFDVCILGSTDRDYGYQREIHIWVTPEDYDNAALMILLGYVLLGHPEWKRGEIKLFASFPEEEAEAEREHLLSLIAAGRLPISAKNVELIPATPGRSRRDEIRKSSRDADLVILGFVGEALLHRREELFEGYEGLCNILWVNTMKEIPIHAEEDEPEERSEEGEAVAGPQEDAATE